MTRTGSTSGGTGQTDVDDPAYTAAIIGTSAKGSFKHASPTLHADLDVFAAVSCDAVQCITQRSGMSPLSCRCTVPNTVTRALDYLRERRLEHPLDQDPLDQDPLDEYPLCSVRHQE